MIGDHHILEELAIRRHETLGFVLKCSDFQGPPWQTRGARVSLKNESGQDFQGILETRSVDALK